MLISFTTTGFQIGYHSPIESLKSMMILRCQPGHYTVSNQSCDSCSYHWTLELAIISSTSALWGAATIPKDATESPSSWLLDLHPRHCSHQIGLLKPFIWGSQLNPMFRSRVLDRLRWSLLVELGRSYWGARLAGNAFWVVFASSSHWVSASILQDSTVSLLRTTFQS